MHGVVWTDLSYHPTRAFRGDGRRYVLKSNVSGYVDKLVYLGPFRTKPALWLHMVTSNYMK